MPILCTLYLSKLVNIKSNHKNLTEMLKFVSSNNKKRSLPDVVTKPNKIQFRY